MSRLEYLIIAAIIVLMVTFAYTEKLVVDHDKVFVKQEISFDLSKRAECQNMGGEMILKWSPRHNGFVLDACKVGGLR